MPDGSPCLDPALTAYQKLVEAIRFSEVNRARADKIIRDHEPQVRRDLQQRHAGSGRKAPLTNEEVWVAAEIRAAGDPKFRSAMDNERWGWRLALMYAAEHQLGMEMRTQDLLVSVVDEIRGVRRDLTAREDLH